MDMRSRFMHLASLVAALAATTIASSVALAQSSGTGAAKAAGVATSAGTVKRTIIDVQPNGPEAGPWGLMQVTSTDVIVSVTAGQNADTIGTHFRNAVNSNVTLAGLGYSSVFTTPNGVTQLSRPKVVRQTGGFTATDVSATPGITFATDPYTVLDAPALSPVGLGFLVGALPALAFWQRRRRKSV
jgi:hypothetical protein